MKKTTLITILQSLVGYRELAEGFLVLVKQSENEQFLDELYTFIKQQIKTVQNEQQKKLINAQLKKIAKQEQVEHEEAESILDDLSLEG
jgi:Na+-translocating ferredoxin:NAD+ oxidoreductase RnfG subunit